MGFHEYDVVRVVKLVQRERPFDGTARVMRAPRVGDVGAIVGSASGAGAYAVECVHPSGAASWLADFLPRELELSQTYGGQD